MNHDQGSLDSLRIMSPKRICLGLLFYLSYSAVALRIRPCPGGVEIEMVKFVDSLDRASRIMQLEQRVEAQSQLLMQRNTRNGSSVTSDEISSLRDSLTTLHSQMTGLQQAMDESRRNFQYLPREISKWTIKTDLAQRKVGLLLRRMMKMEKLTKNFEGEFRETNSTMTRIEEDIIILQRKIAIMGVSPLSKGVSLGRLHKGLRNISKYIANHEYRIRRLERKYAFSPK